MRLLVFILKKFVTMHGHMNVKPEFSFLSHIVLRRLHKYKRRVGFTLSQATKALREGRGIAVLYFRPLH